MKQFLVFKGAKYEPSGGWKDFFGDFDTLDDAKNALLNVNCDWWHIVDTAHFVLHEDGIKRMTETIVAEGERFGT